MKNKVRILVTGASGFIGHHLVNRRKAEGKELMKRHDPSKPQRPRGRNSDNNLLRKTLGWEPSISLDRGLAITYAWIAQELGPAKMKTRTNGELAATG